MEIGGDFFTVFSLTQVINTEWCVIGEQWTENNMEGRRGSLIQTQSQIFLEVLRYSKKYFYIDSQKHDHSLRVVTVGVSSLHESA